MKVIHPAVDQLKMSQIKAIIKEHSMHNDKAHISFPTVLMKKILIDFIIKYSIPNKPRSPKSAITQSHWLSTTLLPILPK